MREILIHFTNVDVVFDSLKEQKIEIEESTRYFIEDIHNTLETTKIFCNKETQIEICYKASNFIIKHLELRYNIKIKRYTKQNWR